MIRDRMDLQKKDLILFYANRLIEAGLNPFLWEGANA